jgi:hypothetical protein
MPAPASPPCSPPYHGPILTARAWCCYGAAQATGAIPLFPLGCDRLSYGLRGDRAGRSSCQREHLIEPFRSSLGGGPPAGDSLSFRGSIPLFDRSQVDAACGGPVVPGSPARRYRGTEQGSHDPGACPGAGGQGLPGGTEAASRGRKRPRPGHGDRGKPRSPAGDKEPCTRDEPH